MPRAPLEEMSAFEQVLACMAGGGAFVASLVTLVCGNSTWISVAVGGMIGLTIWLTDRFGHGRWNDKNLRRGRNRRRPRSR